MPSLLQELVTCDPIGLEDRVCLLQFIFSLFSLLHKSLRIIVIQTQIGKISNVEFEGGC
jgi:hypothetical protein